MPLNIRSEDVNQLADKLAEATGVSKTDAVRTALTNELRRHEASEAYISDRLRQLQERLAELPSVGPKPDKAFYDSLNDE